MVELTVVIVLIATIAAVTAPRFFAALEFEESFFRNDTLGALRYAQKLAVASGCQVRVTISSGGYSNTASSGISLSGDTPITFDALGRALNAGGSVADATVNVGSLSIEVIGETGFAYAP